MSVKRNGDGSITIKNNNGESIICAIIALVDDKWKEKFKQCAKLVTVTVKTI